MEMLPTDGAQTSVSPPLPQFKIYNDEMVYGCQTVWCTRLITRLSINQANTSIGNYLCVTYFSSAQHLEKSSWVFYQVQSQSI